MSQCLYTAQGVLACPARRSGAPPAAQQQLTGYTFGQSEMPQLVSDNGAKTVETFYQDAKEEDSAWSKLKNSVTGTLNQLMPSSSSEAQKAPAVTEKFYSGSCSSCGCV